VLPAGCDGVIPFERIERDGDQYHIQDGVTFKNFNNIHRRGEDFSEGDVVLKAPFVLSAPKIAVAASLGYHELMVKQLPKIAWITTGSELVDVETEPLPHQIRKSNIHAGVAACRARGYTNLSAHHLPDDEQATREALAQLLETHDTLILSGGVSKGKLDFVPSALAAVGVEKVFHRVEQKPGKPLWFGVKDHRRVFGLPGNPASMLVCLERYVLPFLDRSAGLENSVNAVAAQSTSEMSHSLLLPCTDVLPVKPKFTLFKTVRCVATPTGTQLEMCHDHGSGDYAALARGTGFVEIPPAPSAWPVEKTFRYWPWS
jgi:molybdopterin molybdotransferase